MPDNDYIPRDDANFQIWANTFGTRIAAAPQTYMMTAAQAASIQSAVADFAAALAISSAEATRNMGTVADKNDARFIAENLCRQYAMLIKENAGILDSDKIWVGVRPENSERTPINCPQSSPLLSILGNTPGTQTVVYADTTTPDSKAKPFGAANLQLMVGIGTVEPAPLSTCQFYGAFTKNPIAVEFGEADDGKIATFYGRWASARGETGPWSLPISMRIAA
jgi:hypothetical protein